VLFEFGYAIAKNKRTWVLRDPSIEKAQLDYERFKLLTTVGYCSYCNSSDIENLFYDERPYEDLESTLYKDAIESVITQQRELALLYLRSAVETEASRKLTHEVKESNIRVITDDPKEVPVQSLTWYAQQVHAASAVLVHFLSSDHVTSRYQNAKNAFVSGLAYGFGKRLLMLAHEPYGSPIDYREMLKTHDTGTQCVGIASSWLSCVESEYEDWKANSREYEKEARARSELQHIVIGDPVAENESQSLPQYFIPTAEYSQALASRHLVLVGRRGSGKSAILYKLENELSLDLRNHVCVVKPVDYELKGVVRVLSRELVDSEKGFLIESFWKFLIYTELAKSVFEKIESRQPFYHPSDAENQLLTYVKENSSTVFPGFSARLEGITRTLQELEYLRTAEEQRRRISELLHKTAIRELRTILGEALGTAEKVVILIDNLDQAWDPREHLGMLCRVLLGLLDVCQNITWDFGRTSRWRKPVNLSVIIFLRSDIFRQVCEYARESDKIPHSRIVWNDRETLLRVLEERFYVSSSTLAAPQQVWERYFCSTVRGVSTRDYIAGSILPRPRDLIYLAHYAIAQAVNRGHMKVEEEDIYEAQKKYSHYALESIAAETSDQIEELLYEFIGEKEVISDDDLLRAMKRCGIHENELVQVIELLCSLSFLGRETGPGQFEFQHTGEDTTKLQIMARKAAMKRPDRKPYFRINKAFQPYLEIESVL
jgi:hypothetical protein